MRILLACDVKTDGSGNPYTLQLLHALEKNPEVEAVQHGTSWMDVPGLDVDIVHIQWPEALTAWTSPTTERLRRVKETLGRWSCHAEIIVTVHNRYPHGRDTDAFKSLYRSVYANASGIVHLGRRSMQVVRERYRTEVESATEAVIPHGNYDWFPSNVGGSGARQALGISEDEIVFLSFGRVRNRKALSFLHRGFSGVQTTPKRLLIAGRLPAARRTSWRYYTTRLPFWAKSNINLYEGFIPEHRVQYFLRAADVIVVPRLASLNSGNVALGLTYGRVVVGPEHGVIGEMLRETRNPTFDTTDASSLTLALEQGAQLSRGYLPRQNLDYAHESLAWDRIADDHVRLYQKVLGGRDS